MAIIRNNPLTEGLSGMLGRTIVFRQLKGKTIVANRPQSPRKQSALQRTNREKFKEATSFAKAMMKIADKKDYYWQKAKELNLPNAYTAAITDYMRKPVINDLAVKQGNVIIDVHKKDFALVTVEVRLYDKNNTIIENGVAAKNNNGLWEYTMAAQDVIGIEVRVADWDVGFVVRELLI